MSVPTRRTAHFADAVRAQLRLDEPLARIAELVVTEVDGADGAGVTVVLPSGPALLAGTTGYVDVEAVQQGLGEGPSITAAADQRTVLAGAARLDPRWPAFAAEAVRLDLGSALALPLLVGGQLRGVLTVYAQAERAFTPAAVTAAERDAALVAVVVAEAQLLETTRVLADEVHDVLDGRATIDTAVGLLVHRNGISEQEAAEHLGRIAAVHRQTPLATARSILADAAVWVLHPPADVRTDDTPVGEDPADPAARAPVPPPGPLGPQPEYVDVA